MEQEDTALLVEVANAISAGVKRRLPFLEGIPFHRDPTIIVSTAVVLLVGWWLL